MHQQRMFVQPIIRCDERFETYGHRILVQEHLFQLVSSSLDSYFKSPINVDHKYEVNVCIKHAGIFPT